MNGKTDAQRVAKDLQRKQRCVLQPFGNCGVCPRIFSMADRIKHIRNQVCGKCGISQYLQDLADGLCFAGDIKQQQEDTKAHAHNGPRAVIFVPPGEKYVIVVYVLQRLVIRGGAEPCQCHQEQSNGQQLILQIALGGILTDIASNEIISHRIKSLEITGYQFDLRGKIVANVQTLGNNGHQHHGNHHGQLLFLAGQRIECRIDKGDQQEYRYIVFNIPSIVGIVEHDHTA